MFAEAAAVSANEIKKLADVFGGISCDVRLDILLALAGGAKCVGEIAQEVGASSPKVSFHLTRMKFAGLVTGSRQGQRVVYKTNNEEIMQLIRFLESLLPAEMRKA